MSLMNKVILIYIASERILLAQLNPPGESWMQPVVVVLQYNNLNYPDPHLEIYFFNPHLYNLYLKPDYRSRKSTHANVEYGPGSFKQVHDKLPNVHLIQQFKKLLQLKEKMENKA